MEHAKEKVGLPEDEKDEIMATKTMKLGVTQHCFQQSCGLSNGVNNPNSPSTTNEK